jgi:hypothetical protein
MYVDEDEGVETVRARGVAEELASQAGARGEILGFDPLKK